MLPIAYYILYVFINEYIYIGGWYMPVISTLWMLTQGREDQPGLHRAVTNKQTKKPKQTKNH